MTLSPKTNENSRAVVNDAGAFQVGSLTGRHPDTTPNQKAEAPRQKIDHAKIDSFISPRELSKSWAPYGCRGPFFLPLQPHIAIKSTSGQGVVNGGFHLEWFASQTGVGGVGAVSLVAHVLKVSKDEAAWRLAHWLALGQFAGARGFLDAVTSQTDEVRS